MRTTLNVVQLDHVCTIQRRSTSATDPDGQPIYTWANHAINIRCHYWEEAEKELHGVPNAAITRERVLLNAGVDVTADDKITSVTSYDGTVIGPLDIEEVLVRVNDTLLECKAVR